MPLPLYIHTHIYSVSFCIQDSEILYSHILACSVLHHSIFLVWQYATVMSRSIRVWVVVRVLPALKWWEQRKVFGKEDIRRACVHGKSSLATQQQFQTWATVLQACRLFESRACSLLLCSGVASGCCCSCTWCRKVASTRCRSYTASSVEARKLLVPGRNPETCAFRVISRADGHIILMELWHM